MGAFGKIPKICIYNLGKNWKDGGVRSNMKKQTKQNHKQNQNTNKQTKPLEIKS